MDECVHGMNPAWCGICRGDDEPANVRRGASGLHGGRIKQDVLDEVCDLLGRPRAMVSTGSSLPSDVFADAARAVGVGLGSMPEVAEAIVLKAGRRWSPSFDSRATISGGGSTVTMEGLEAMRDALRILLR